VVTVGFGLIATVISWPVSGLAPSIGLDSSWEFGLASAAVHHIAWGPHLDFTYGPLGFLGFRTLWFASTATLALVYAFVVQFASFALLLHFTRKALPLPIAALISFAIGVTAGGSLFTPAFLLAILALRQREQFPRRLLIALISAVSAVGFLIEFNGGLIPLISVIVIIAVAVGYGRQWLMDGAIAAVTFFLVLIICWLATGNSLGDLPAYFRYGASIAGGYASAMQFPIGRTDWLLYAAIVLLIVGALATLSLKSQPRREQLGTALVVGVYAFWAFKEEFVAHARAGSYDAIFFGMMFVIAAAFGLASSRLRPYYVTAVAIIGVIVWSAAGGVPDNMLTWSADVHSFGHQINIVAKSKIREATIGGARTEIREGYALSPRMVSELSGHTVAIEPWDNSVAWAYPSIRWDPEPVLQAYAAYTSTLDTLDSSFIQSSEAPSRILEQRPMAIGDRYPFFDPPTTVVATVCHYVQLDASPNWQVLRRVPNRCGSARFLARTTATFRKRVRVPIGPPGSIVVARFQSLPLSLTYKISSLILHPPIMYLTASGRPYRFLPGTAADLHLLRGTSSIGYSNQFSPSAISQFHLSGAGVSPGSGRYVVSFYSISVAGT